MVASGFVRKLDELGRIVLPIEIRKTFQIRERDPLEIFVDNDKIILKKYEPGDIFTGELDNLVEYKGRKFSRSTIEDLARHAGYDVSKRLE
ncbi:MAG: AbrB/MazE/SpoVT family DNA-binding domain-containing protein [Defluviitaleaceae bacterium]|nr:AbrB/MazE/SpoVT family DNA-binding domain-containing protein [Defluviitaleaceae bacterium]